MSEHVSPRVNAARLPAFKGRTVRMPCKVLRFQTSGLATVQTSDGAEVEVRLPNEHSMTATFVEVIGTVLGDAEVRLLGCINFEEEFDMKLVNDTIELTFDPRFQKIFPQQ